MAGVEEATLKKICDELRGKIVGVKAPQPRRLYVKVRNRGQRDVLKSLMEEDEVTDISAITGVDSGDKIELLYHVRAHGVIITIEAELPKECAVTGSITDLMPGANFHEREVADLLGVTFEGHPSPGRLILPDGWPEKLHPLRKDFDVAKVAGEGFTKFTGGGFRASDGDAQRVTVTLGPQHPALIEPERFTLKVEGEVVRKVEPRIGYVHRGIEKLAEGCTLYSCPLSKEKLL